MVQVYSGKSAHSNMQDAIEEATSYWPEISELQGSTIFCFYSLAEQAEILAPILAEQFPGTIIVGCSTAGEWLDGSHYDSHLVMMAIASEHIQWSAIAIENLDNISDESITQTLSDLVESLSLRGTHLHCDRNVCITMVDGLSRQEEQLSAMLAKHLVDIPILGGSSGDGMRFEQTSLLIQEAEKSCRVIEHGALLLLLDSDIKMQPIMHQHFDVSDTELVITSATPEKRMVHTLNGINAAACYAQWVGCLTKDLSPDVFSDYPLIYNYRHELYVRSIQKVEDDGSLTFYCGVEEGLILNLGRRKCMEKEFSRMMDEINQYSQTAQAALVFNCIMRSVESKHLDCCQRLGQQLQQSVPRYIGFDSYGQQWNGRHLNQTLTALVFHELEEETCE